MSEAKLAQLVQLASKVQVKEGLVNKLISNQKVINHLSRVGRISGITMHGMILLLPTNIHGLMSEVLQY